MNSNASAPVTARFARRLLTAVVGFVALGVGAVMAAAPASAIIAPLPHGGGAPSTPVPVPTTDGPVVLHAGFPWATLIAVALLAVVLAAAVTSAVRNRHRAVATAPGL